MVDPVPLTNWTPPSTAPASPQSSWQPNQGDVFESALKRADSSRTNENTDEPSTDEAEFDEDGVDRSSNGESKALDDAARERSLRSPLDDLKNGSRSLELDASERDIQLQSGGPSTRVSTEAASTTERAAGTAAQAPLMVETVAAMMMRLDRMPEVNAGQWQFNLLNDPAGINALQLQRTLNGSWRVNVSLHPGSEVDQEQHADELKSALEMRGYEVDSVELTSASFDAELNES